VRKAPSQITKAFRPREFRGELCRRFAHALFMGIGLCRTDLAIAERGAAANSVAPARLNHADRRRSDAKDYP
jgi:hypothetical protein